MLNEVRYALRNLLASPAFALVAVASLAVGIGINTTIFTVVNAVLLRPLPVADPDRLVDIYTTSDVEHSSTSWLDYQDIRRGTEAFSGVIGHSLMFANISRDGRSRIVLGEVVTANYFDVLGVRAAIGRTFTPEEDAAEGANRVTVLSDGFWRREFAGAPSIIGREVRIRGAGYTVVGVAPAAFNGMMPGIAPELWVPASMVEDVEPVGIQDVVPSPTGATRLQRRGQRWMFVKGRLAPGSTLAQAEAQVSSVMARLETEYPATNRNRRAMLVPTSRVRIHPLVDGSLVPGAVLLMVAVSLVLAIACANVANMLLARATTRSREIAIRLAIGAGRGRIIRQLLTESVILAVLGGWAGFLLARWTIGLLLAFQPPLPISISLNLHPDWRVFVFTLLVSLVTGAVFGLAPAVHSTKTDLVRALKSEVTPGARRRRFGMRDTLVVAQVAFCFVLLVGAGLLLRSLAASRAADVGFETHGLAIATVDLDMHRYTPDRGRLFYRDALERVKAIPGVTSAALVERLPFSPNVHTQAIFIDGRTYQEGDRGAITDSTRVSEGYFRTLGVPVLRGRDFDGRDTPASPGVVIVNETMARRYWTDEEAIGKRIRIHGADGPAFEVVGVVADHKVRTVGEAPRPLVHFARGQGYNPSATLLARTSGDDGQLVRAMRSELTALEPELVLLENQTMTSSMATTLFPAQVSAMVVGIAGGIALLLAAVGLYGLIAYSVSRRTKEIGLRMALGASPSGVLALVIRQGLGRVLIGVGVGAVIAAGLTRLMQNALYGVGAVDPASYAGAAVLLLLVALAANVVPARRAARVDPMIALRDT